MVTRRKFIENMAAVSAVSALSPRWGASADPVPAAAIHKAVLTSLLRRDAQRLAELLKTVPLDLKAVREVHDSLGKFREGLDKMNTVLRLQRLDTVREGFTGMETSLRNAKLWGADTVLLVPAVVNPQTSYQDAWTRSQKVIRERLLPLASDLKVVIAVEEVWNKFLLSPIEFVRYVDEMGSPWVKAYFDVGNVVFYGYPQDWVRTLGPRIAKVHLKDFQLDRPSGKFAWKNLGEGDIDWVEVRKAFADVGYDGWMTTELTAPPGGGDAAYLKDVVARFDRFLAGEKPVGDAAADKKA